MAEEEEAAGVQHPAPRPLLQQQLSLRAAPVSPPRKLSGQIGVTPTCRVITGKAANQRRQFKSDAPGSPVLTRAPFCAVDVTCSPALLMCGGGGGAAGGQETDAAVGDDQDAQRQGAAPRGVATE